ncbi:MAG: restriction endonuclease subunit S, partial [Pseudomonadota bacterium]|nr:restriction endonuclease subunit S [Pseudomonadota bacterium]
MIWPLVKLSDILEFHRGITFKPEDKVETFSPSSLVCMITKNVQAKIDESDIIAVPEGFVKRDELY